MTLLRPPRLMRPVIRARRPARLLALLAAGLSTVAILGAYRAVYQPEQVVDRQSAKVQSQLPDLARQTTEIRETVWRQTLDGGEAPDSRHYFLCIVASNVKSDPDDAFMQRFAGHKPAVKKVSDCYLASDGVRDKASGESGIILKIGHIIWQTKTEVYVSAGYFEGILGAGGGWYLLRRENGRWRVVRQREDWVS